MKILGVHIGHDSSAALIVDGKIVADVAEERFNRIKHFAGLPIKSIEFCLKSHSIDISDIDYIAVPSKFSLRALNFLFNLQDDELEKKTVKRRIFDTFIEFTSNKKTEKPPIYIKNFKKAPHTQIVHVEHHLAHAASGYYTSGISEKQLIITLDGGGDGISGGIWRGENNSITPIMKIPKNGSLGYFYSNVTEALGWIHGDGEGKTMGLAPYGNEKNVQGLLDKFCPKFSNGKLVEECEFNNISFWNENGSYHWHIDDAYKIKKLIDRHGAEDIAAEAQKVLEKQVFEIIFPWLEKENTQNLTCAGGVFLNVKLNQRIWDTGKIKNHVIYPNSGDSGLAVGAALYVYYSQNPNAPKYKIEDLYWGTEYTDNEIIDVLKLRNIPYKYVENIEEFAAQQLANNKIVAWFQGRMESGPRALGNRSILMSANNKDNKDIINARVKFREAFRPFCPSILCEKKDEYLENARDEFFMITSFTCKEAKRDKVPAVVHADFTLRPQTVKKEFNPRFWKLINEFGKITGEYLLLNTSFNIMGEPIINHPREAIRCFYDNGLDFLIMNNFVLSKDINY